jgi:hypothetical protein
MDYMTTMPRTLVNVQRELSVALQHKTRDMLKIGSLLKAWGMAPVAATTHGVARTNSPTVYGGRGLGRRQKRNRCAFGPRLSQPGGDLRAGLRQVHDETVERVLDAAAATQRHINESDVKEIAKTGAEAAIFQEIEADQKAAAEGEASCEADRVKWEAAQHAEEAEAKREQAEEAEAKREQAEVEAILDGGPDPDLPPPSVPVVLRRKHSTS